MGFIMKLDKGFGKSKAIPDNDYWAKVIRINIYGTRIVNEVKENIIVITFDIGDKNSINKYYYVPDAFESNKPFVYLLLAAWGDIPPSFDLDDLIGCEVLLKIKNEDKNGIWYTNIKRVSRLPEATYEEGNEDSTTSKDELDFDLDEVETDNENLNDDDIVEELVLDEDEPEPTNFGRRKRRVW